MVKAKDFWNYLCNDLNYRFFAGVACRGLIPLYDKMSSELMHYIPTANERIALGMLSGAYVAGFKGGLLMDMKYSYDLTSLFEFNIDYKIPFLVIGYSDREEANLAYDFPKVVISDSSYKKALKEITFEIESKTVPGLVVLEKGVLI